MCTLKYLFTVIIACTVILFGRILYIIFVKENETIEKKKRTHPIKTMIILGSGGHTAELLRIIKHLNPINYTPRVYIHAKTDEISPEKVKQIESNNSDYKITKIYRSREVRQSYFTSVWTTIYATLECIPLMLKEKPELLLCNGPGTCVPLCFISFILNVFYITQTKIVFIESFCRVKSLSLTGKLLYYIADKIIVQWPYLSKPVMCHKSFLIKELVPWESLLKDLKVTPNEIKVHLTPIVYSLIESSCEENVKDCNVKWVGTSLLRVESYLDRIWEILHSGHWRNVPVAYRYCYSLCTIVKAVLLEIQYEISEQISSDRKIKVLQNILELIDKGILLGAPLPSSLDLLTSIASKINEVYQNEFPQRGNISQPISCKDNVSDVLIPGFDPVKCYDEPSMELFYTDIFNPKVPAILRGCMKHWQAMRLWQDANYLTRVAGARTVPIEIGSRYTEEDWSLKLVKLSNFLEEYIIKGQDKVGYLAQHQLFEQIPELKSDFVIPDYCSFSDNDNNEAEQPDINAWFGPNGTVSPLHYDPKNNLLCQVFGYKRVILYSPDDTENLYPYSTRLLKNTAQVDPFHQDYEKWPNFRNAKGIMCYLRPGEMLYIPPKWWHHVTALTPSFSVSFWWK